MAEPLDPHELGHLDRTRGADLREVVAGEVDEHQVLGLLFGVGEQLGLEIGILLGVRAARLRAGDRMREHAATLHLDERFGRGAHDPVRLARDVFEVHEVHVRARVEAAQHAIHVERVRRGLVLEPLRDDHLEHVAVVDVQLRSVDGAEEIVAFGAMARIGGARQVDVGEPRLGRLREALLHAVEARLGAPPEGVGGFGGVVEHRRDELHRARAVVDDDELGDERERLAGNPRFGRRPVRQVLDLPHRLPADEAHEPAGERRSARHVFGAPALEHRLEGLQRRQLGRIAEGTLGVEPVVEPLDPVVGLGEDAVRRDAHERVPRPDAALFRRFEQEGARAPAGELAVDAHRGLAVGEQLAHDGHDPVDPRAVG